MPRGEVIRLADAGQLEEMRRADRAGGEDHLARRVGDLDAAGAREYDAGRALAVERDVVYQRAGHDLQIRPLRRRLQIGLRGAGATPAAAGLLAPTDAVAGAGRQVVDVRSVIDAELPAASMIAWHTAGRSLIGEVVEEPAPAVQLAVFALPALGLLEKRQYVVPAPAAVAKLRPMVEIFGLAADIDQAVDRGGAAEHAAARIGDGAAGGAGIGLGLEVPGQGRVVEQLHEADRDVDQWVPVAPAGLDQQDSVPGSSDSRLASTQPAEPAPMMM